MVSQPANFQQSSFNLASKDCRIVPISQMKSVIEHKAFYSIIYLTKGKQQFYIGKESFLLSAQSYLVVNNRKLLSIDHYLQGQGFVILLSPTLVTNVCSQLQQKDKMLIAHPFHSWSFTIPYFFEHIFHTPSDQLMLKLKALATVHDQGSKSDCRQIVQSLIFAQQPHLKALRKIKSKKYSTRKELYRRVLRGREFLLDNWNDQVVLEDAARAASLSPYHFHRTFRDVFGLAPAQFVRKVKMEKATDLLINQQISIKEIAHLLGYADGFAFSKSFKREKGMAPVYFRRS